MLFTACEKDVNNQVTDAALNPLEDAIRKESEEQKELIRRATELEQILLKKESDNKSLSLLNVDHVVCEALLNRLHCNNLKAYETVNISTEIPNIFAQGLLSLTSLNEFMNDIETWVASENLKISDFKGNFLIDLVPKDDIIEVRLIQMLGQRIEDVFGDRPDDNYTNEDHYSAYGEFYRSASPGPSGFRSNEFCFNLGGNRGAPEIITQRINRVLRRVFYEGYYVDIEAILLVNYFRHPALCSGDNQNEADEFWAEVNDFDSCDEILSPDQMKFHTNGYYDYARLEIDCFFPTKEWISIGCYWGLAGSSFIIEADYTYGTFILNPVIDGLNTLL